MALWWRRRDIKKRGNLNETHVGFDAKSAKLAAEMECPQELSDDQHVSVIQGRIQNFESGGFD